MAAMKWSFVILCVGLCSTASMVVPTVTIEELSNGISDPKISGAPKKVLEYILNDFMDLAYSKETSYTTGKQVLPTDVTIDEMDAAAADLNVDKKFRDIFVKFAETHKSGDLTPQSEVNGWDPKLRPVLVVVVPNRF